MDNSNYPNSTWKSLAPEQAGFDPQKLELARCWVDKWVGTEGRYRIVVVRKGRMVIDWNYGVSKNEPLSIASASKSIYSSILGIAIEEGKIPSIDTKIIDIYPEAMDVPEGRGPKPGQHAFGKDRSITFRQLISNTSGYMKPGELPGEVFHYQSWGMNILTHAIAKVYGLYDVNNITSLPGLKQLMKEKLADPIGASWEYYYMNFDMHSNALVNVYGNYEGVRSTAHDMARLGWLWRNSGRWKNRQIIPQEWMRESTQTARDIRQNCLPEQWKYGYGFHTNDHGKLWPELPCDSFASSGKGKQKIWVCPSLDMVIVQGPGPVDGNEPAENDTGILAKIVEACD